MGEPKGKIKGAKGKKAKDYASRKKRGWGITIDHEAGENHGKKKRRASNVGAKHEGGNSKWASGEGKNYLERGARHKTEKRKKID